jgi:hypothetical protein
MDNDDEHSCEAGSYSSESGAFGCQSCLPGTNMSSTGATRCETCPLNTQSLTIGMFG